MRLNDLLKTAVDNAASDLHLKVGGRPMMRLRGALVPSSETRIEADEMLAFAAAVMPQEIRERFEREHEADLAYSVPGVSRFRCNIYRQRGTTGMVFRVIPVGVSKIDDLSLPPVVKKIAAYERGLVLVTGTTGSGKSTTLAAIIDEINSTRSAHVITIEDPIEYLHRDNRSIVNQREIGADTNSFAKALRAALRQDPDVILVGEMRDHETIETALLAADTGHLVLSTLHTTDAAETINRVVSVFPPHQQKQIRIQLAGTLKAVISQRLMTSADGQGRVPALEIMISTAFIRDCILDKDRAGLIPNAIAQGGSQYGMQSFDQSVFSLFKQNLVTKDEALRWVSNVDDFMLKVQGVFSTSDEALEKMTAAAGPARGTRLPEITRFGS
jgi:twitching motility protein PilT